MQLLCYSHRTKESPEATKNVSAAIDNFSSGTREYLPSDGSASKQKKSETVNPHFSATTRTLESQQKHRARMKVLPQQTAPSFSESSFSLNEESPRLLQSQKKHCARMSRIRTKQSPDIERLQKQKHLLQRMIATPPIAQRPERLHSPIQLQNRMPETQSPRCSYPQQTPPYGHQHPQLLDKSLQQRKHESFQIQQHSKRQNQTIENQQPHQRGSVALRHVIESSSNSGKFERIFAILEALNVNCQFFDVLKLSLDILFIFTGVVQLLQLSEQLVANVLFFKN
jgi:hypothetical protein